jgi:hypothetical protein
VKFRIFLTGKSCISPSCQYYERTQTVFSSDFKQSLSDSGWSSDRNSGSCNNGRSWCIAKCLRNRHGAGCRLTWNGEMLLQVSMLLQQRCRRLWLSHFIPSTILRSRVSGKRNYDGQMFNNALSLFLTTHRAMCSLYWRSFALHSKTV